LVHPLQDFHFFGQLCGLVNLLVTAPQEILEGYSAFWADGFNPGFLAQDAPGALYVFIKYFLKHSCKAHFDFFLSLGVLGSFEIFCGIQDKPRKASLLSNQRQAKNICGNEYSF